MRKLSVILLLLFAFPPAAWACESCSLPLARSGAGAPVKKKAFFDVTFEQQVWRARSARDAHNLHHEGRHIHNKTHEELTHFTAGYDLREDLSLVGELPYVRRTVIEIDSHPNLGEKQRVEGWGDLKLNLIWRAWQRGSDFFGALGGVKVPTGSTQEMSPLGARYEGEFQPGSGSVDPQAGGVFMKDWGSLRLHGNAIYAMRSEGAHHFKLGDLFSSFVILDMPFAAGGKDAWLGLDSNFQVEGRHETLGVENPDSGGTTWLLGPSLKVQADDGVSVLANVLFPVAQDPGGFHQTVKLVWNVSVRVNW